MAADAARGRAGARGRLPARRAALAEVGTRPFGIYVHVPFCTQPVRLLRLQHLHRRRAARLRPAPAGPVSSRPPRSPSSTWRAGAGTGRPELSTIFVGGGTPTRAARRRPRLLVAAVANRFRLAAGRGDHHRGQPGIRRRRRAGPAGASCGSPGSPSGCSRPSRTCSPPSTGCTRRPPGAGGGRGEGGRIRARQPRPDLRHARRVARRLAGQPGDGAGRGAGPHQRVRVGRRARHPAGRPGPAGRAAAPDDDDLADKYLLADERAGRRRLRRLRGEQLGRGSGARCRHNLGYWRGHDWWGIGPGAHSHVGGVRWWNVKHPARYAARLAAGVSPAQAREVLTDHDRRTSSGCCSRSG